MSKMAVDKKRKQPVEEVAPKPSKRQRSESENKSKDRKTKQPQPAQSAPVKNSTSSILSKEQPAFPRGGAGLLTPLEKKQISARAARDVAAEQSKSQELFGSRHGVSEESDADSVESDLEAVKEKTNKKKAKRSKIKETSDEKNVVSIEGLSYKRLAVGSLVLGRISSINSQDLTVSLPNNLSGFVPITSISAVFSEKLEQVLNGGHENTGEGEDNGDDGLPDLDLKSYFRVGQYLRTAVTSLGTEASGQTQSKKKIMLTLDPRHVNIGITKSSLVVGCTVQASVASVEDHGIVVDLGVQDGKEVLKGFITAKALTPSMPLADIKPGAVMLCIATSDESNSKVIRLRPDLSSSTILKTAPTVDAFLPGTLVNFLVTQTMSDGIAGKLMGLVDVTADIVHSGSFKDRETFTERYKIGQKLKGRLLFTLPLSDNKKIGLSILEDVVQTVLDNTSDSNDDNPLKISAIVESTRVTRVAPGLGIYLAMPSGKFGFAHISRLSDKKTDSVSETTGIYKVGSQHKVRILDYNAMDGLFILTLQQKVIEQSFLRIEDVTVGEVVKATIDKILVGQSGVQGLIVNLAEGITGLVPEIHMSDIKLLHPEKKFREGQTVTARVLSIDLVKRQMRLTLKKTLVNGDQKIWATFENIATGDSTIGTLVKVDPHGALVQFYGEVRGFLPVSEMSEAYIKDATEHFKLGQVLTVNALSVNAEEERLTVSCRDRGAADASSLASVVPGTLVSGTVFEKSQKDLLLRLQDSDVIARLALDHISDGSEKKRRSTLDKIRVGQRLDDVLVLDVQRTGRLVILCNRQSLIKASQSGQFLKSWEELKEDAVVTGYVSNITDAGVFVRFADNINGLITKHQVPSEAENQPDFGLTLLQAVTARVTSIDNRGATPRFWLSMRKGSSQESQQQPKSKQDSLLKVPDVVLPVDDSVSSFTEFVVGKVTKARIVSIKDTQLNVELAKDIQGRIDVSEIFDDWQAIKDRKQPLRIFNPKQILDVRILGAHDTRNHRFLPLSHRAGKNTVFELSAKPSTIEAQDLQILSLSDMQVGSSWIAFVNNAAEDRLMVNVSPSVRGRVWAIDASDDLSLAADLQTHFPLGSALRVKVKSVDLEKNHLDLTGKSSVSDKSLTLHDLSRGTVLPGRVTKVSDRSILVQISDDIVGAVELIDMADDYAQSNPAAYQRNDAIRVCVLKVDVANKKVFLSTRPSKVLSSSMKVTDSEIVTVEQLKEGDIVRGFISNVTDKGLFITLGHGVTAFVRVTNLSDAYLKSWKDSFQRDQLVKGRVVSIDKANNHIQLSLKASAVSGIYKPPVTFSALKVGEVVTGKVVKVETFGVFILVDNSENVRGLCHRSEMAEQRIEDASKLFSQGDAVKAKVLKLDLPNRRINFGLKASYFDNDEEMADVNGTDKESNSESDESDTLGGAEIDEESDNQADTDIDAEELDVTLEEADDDSAEASSSEEDVDEPKMQLSGLNVGGFDWFGMSADTTTLKRHAELDNEDSQPKSKRKKRKSEIQVDRTGELDARGPQSTDDFERLLLGEPNSSLLWLQYMSFHVELGDIDAARSIGERALKSIGLGQDAEKMIVWTALLNLENAYGDDESIDTIFKRALEYCDAQEIYGRLVSIYIQSGKHAKADALFQEMLKKFTQDPKVYINYATFLFDTMQDADKARAQLKVAIQVLPSFAHFELTSKFAQLEFTTAAGLPERGRTIFEGLFNSFPKRVDLFNILLDMEMRQLKTKQGDSDVARALFERIFEKKLKPKQAKHFFKRWLTFEEEQGDARRVEEVKARAATWVKSQT